jgi:hypothetical protein
MQLAIIHPYQRSIIITVAIIIVIIIVIIISAQQGIQVFISYPAPACLVRRRL